MRVPASQLDARAPKRGGLRVRRSRLREDVEGEGEAGAYGQQLTQYDERGCRATFYTTWMKHSTASGPQSHDYSRGQTRVRARLELQP